jgi:hypothetical protein
MGRKYVKQLVFERRNFSRVTSSDASKIKLNVATNRLELVVQGYDVNGDPYYSTDADLTITTWAMEPAALLQWVGFAIEPISPLQPTGASVGLKLNDGTNDRYWNGATWAVAGASDWNTEAEVAANIGDFPCTSHTLSVVINLATTDRYVTPAVSAICLMMNVELDYLRSIVADSLVPALRDSIQPTFDFAMRAPGGARLSLRDLETKHEVLDVESVYNHTQDPDHLTNLLGSFDSSSKTVLLTSPTAIARGEDAWIRINVQPKVYVNWASQDYVEVERIPAVVVNTILATGNIIAGRAYVKNADALTAQVQRFPFRLSLEFEVLLLAKDNRTLLVMMDHALSFCSDNQLLHWQAVDEYLSLTPLIGQNFAPRPNLSDKHQATFGFRLDDVNLWLESETTEPLIQNVVINLEHTSNGLRFGQLRTGVKTEP